MCTIHKRPFTIFYSDCEKLICQHCTLKDHLGHNYELTNVAVTGVKTKLLQDIQSIKQNNRKSLLMPLKRFVLLQLCGDSKIICYQQPPHFLQGASQHLGATRAGISRRWLQKLSQQENTLSLASAELQSIVDYTERCVSLSTDNELVSMDTERKTIQQKIQDHSKSGRSLEPVQEAGMAVEVTHAEALQQLCVTQAIFIP